MSPEPPDETNLLAVLREAGRVLAGELRRDTPLRRAALALLEVEEVEEVEVDEDEPDDETPAAPPQPRRDVVLRLGDTAATVRAVGGEADLARADAARPVVPPPSVVPFFAPASFDPSLVARRCRLKATAARWQIERDGLDREAMVDGDRRIIAAAKAFDDCYLWMTRPDLCRSRTPAAMHLVAGCYDALAEAAALVGEATPAGALPGREHLTLLAEAQSGLAVALDRVAEETRDSDQRDAFIYARESAGEMGYFMDRFLRPDVAADPDDHADLRSRIATAREAFEAGDADRRQTEKLLGKFRYAAGKLAESDAEPGGSHLEALRQAAGGLAARGVPPTDRRLREWLLPLAGRLTAADDGPLGRVLEAVDDHLDRLNAEEDEGGGVREDPADLVEARRLLAGRTMVLIGGRVNERRRVALQADLGLAELRWITVSHGKPFDAAERELMRDEVTVAAVLTRFRSHRDGPDARAVCRRRNIPLVELTGGYGLHLLAHAVVGQASEALART